MLNFQNKLFETNDFLIGIELVSTRGSMSDASAIKIRNFSNELVACEQLDWVSITDNAGGYPMLAPTALGKQILYGGKDVVIHLSCKDFNRNALESAAWLLASEGFNNLLAVSGDAPIAGSEGLAKAVFDIDSIGLLTLLGNMNKGLAVQMGHSKRSHRLNKTNFLAGAVTTNFKLYENEVIPQYLKLEKKIECGARFIINQIGYDSRKNHELIAYMRRRNLGQVPLIGNTYVLNPGVARLFHEKKIPGVVVSDTLMEVCQKQGRSPDKGKSYFLELAAKQLAIYRALGYRGAYLGGLHNMKDLMKVIAIEKSFSPGDWKQFAAEIRYSRPYEFFLLQEDPETGLANPDKLHPAYLSSLQKRVKSRNISFNYRLSKWTHGLLFTPGKGLARKGEKLCAKASDPSQGPKWLRLLEHTGKAAMFQCKDCGDCSLPDIAYLCPESQCAKNQRNGPCGGTRDGKCEVEDYQCIWSRAYDRLKYEGQTDRLLEHSPVIQDQGLRGTSSWANNWLGRDHQGKKRNADKKPPVPLVESFSDGN